MPAKKRFLLYSLLGLAFGVFDWYYLDGLAHFPWGPLGENLIVVPIIILLNYGIWLVPVIPVAIYEARRSQRARSSALASALTWSAALLGYYAYYTVLLAFWGLPQMEHMLVFTTRSATFWQDWWVTFDRVILAQLLDWLPVGILGGAIIGFLTARFALRRSKPGKTAALKT